MMISNSYKPYPAEPMRVCCVEEGQSSAVCVWRKSDKHPEWLRSQPHHWGIAAGLPSPPENSAGQYPAAHAGTAEGPVSLSGTPVLLGEWADKSPTQMSKTKACILLFLKNENTLCSVLTTYLNGKESTWHLQNRCIIEIFGEEFNVDGGRHENQSQIRPQEQKWTQNSQQKVTVQVSLMNLIHD